MAIQDLATFAPAGKFQTLIDEAVNATLNAETLLDSADIVRSAAMRVKKDMDPVVEGRLTLLERLIGIAREQVKGAYEHLYEMNDMLDEANGVIERKAA